MIVLKCDKEKIENVKQSPCVNAESGVSKENHNVFWKEKKYEHKNINNLKSEEDKSLKKTYDNSSNQSTTSTCDKERIENVKQTPCVNAESGVSKENHNVFWKEKKRESKDL